MPGGFEIQDFGSKNGYKKRCKHTLSFTSDFEANFHAKIDETNMNYSAPVEAGTLKLRNRGFACKSDFYIQKLPNIEQTIGMLGNFWLKNGFQNYFQNLSRFSMRFRNYFSRILGGFGESVGSFNSSLGAASRPPNREKGNQKSMQNQGRKKGCQKDPK